MLQKYFTPIFIGRIRFCIHASTGVEWMTFNHGWRILATFLWIHLFVSVHCIDLLRTSHAEKKKLLSFNFKICLLKTRQCRHKEREKPSSQFQISKVVSFHFTKAVVPLHLSSRRKSMANVIQIQLRWMYCANENPTHLPERAKKGNSTQLDERVEHVAMTHFHRTNAKSMANRLLPILFTMCVCSLSLPLSIFIRDFYLSAL